MELNVLLNGLFWIYIVSCVTQVYSRDRSCSVDINGCKYNVHVTPKNGKCDRKHIFDKTSFIEKTNVDRLHINNRRQKRSTNEDGRINDKSPVTKADWNKMNKMVERALEKMSTRVLRWWRKLDRKVDELASGSRGPRSRSTHMNHHCPDGFIGVENWPSCYMMSHFNTSWYEAKDYCNAFESDLVAMGTVKEHFLLTFLIKNNPATMKADGWWTSGSFIGNTKQWMWTSQFFTKPFTFIKWSEGEPNEEGSQCMLLKRIHGHQWNDDICTKQYNFVCEVNIHVS